MVRRYFGDAAELTELESKKVKNVDVSVSSCPVCMQAGRCSKKYYNLNGNTKPVLKLRRHYKISWRSSLSQGTRIAKRSQPSRIGLLAWPDAEERERRYVIGASWQMLAFPGRPQWKAARPHSSIVAAEQEFSGEEKENRGPSFSGQERCGGHSRRCSIPAGCWLI